MKVPPNSLILRLIASAILLQVSALAVVACSNISSQDAEDPPAQVPPPETRKPVFRNAEFYGVNTGIFDIFMDDNSWNRESPVFSDNVSLEARVKVLETSTGNAMAGISFFWDGDSTGYNLGILPNQDRWFLFDAAAGTYLGSFHEQDGFDLGRWYTIKATVSGDRIHVFIDGARKSPPEGFPRSHSSGKMSLRVRNSSALFDDVSITDDLSGKVLFAENFDSGAEGWAGSNEQSWSWVPGEKGAYRGSVLLGREALMSREISPKMNEHFDQMAAAGAHSVRVFFQWNDIQPESRDSYYWDYADAAAIAAHDRNMALIPVPSYAPGWAVSEENRAQFDYYAYPPRDNADYARFVSAVVERYKPGGKLAQQMGWPDDQGVTYFEIGHEYNIGRVIKADGQIFFTGWMGTLGQYVDLLKAGHDAVKAACPDCLVLNGAAADDMQPAYITGRVDEDGWRQHVWQGVEDLYEEIQRRHPGDPHAADRYFDILNIHTYLWYMLSGGGQLPDKYRYYSFPDPQWYRDRLTNVTDVMKHYGDAQKKLWLTETGFASGDNGDPYGGHLDEPGQAKAVSMVYEETSRFPQLDRVFWWYSYDTNTNTGLIRKDLSVKPSYEVYSQLTGKAPQMASPAL